MEDGRGTEGMMSESGDFGQTGTVLGPLFARAFEMAYAWHGAQRRKGSGTPYIAHLMGVASLVLEAGGSEDEAIAALRAAFGAA